MNYVLLGTAGFMLMHLLDFASFKKVSGLKPVLWFVGTGLIVYAVVMVAVTGDRLNFPVWSQFAGWVLFSVASYFMAYSLYVALPFGNTYVAPGTSGQLITHGLYSLVRHPWLLFFAFTMVGLVFATKSMLALEAGTAWTALSVILVYLQDRYVFPRMFPDYTGYRKSTPMLIPNKRSLSAFFKGLNKNNKLEVQAK